MRFISQIVPFSFVATLAISAPISADQDTSKVMEEFFDLFGAPYAEIEVLEKRDDKGSTRWENVTLIESSEAFQAQFPWVEVSKKPMGGYSVRMAPEVRFSGISSESGVSMQGVLIAKDLQIDVNGQAANRNYVSTFSGLNMNMTSEEEFEMVLRMGEGKSNLTKIEDVLSGTFDYSDMDINYGLLFEGQTMQSEMAVQSMMGKYRMPVMAMTQIGQLERYLEQNASYFIDYEMKAMSSKTTLPGADGGGQVNITGKEVTGRMNVNDGNVAMRGEGNGIEYSMMMPSSGMPAIHINLERLSSAVSMPVENMDMAKPAAVKLEVSGLALDPAIWAAFDPKGVLPKSKADITIDLEGNLKWVSKISELVENPMKTMSPIMLEDAKVTAINLSALGAELKSTGKFRFNNSTFPPVPAGTLDVSLKGVNELMDKLSRVGLLPDQNAMAAKGVMGLFFKQGGEGSDHLTSQIIFSPNGGITANGFPLK